MVSNRTPRQPLYPPDQTKNRAKNAVAAGFDGIELHAADTTTFNTADAEGYTDYPTLAKATI